MQVIAEDLFANDRSDAFEFDSPLPILYVYTNTISAKKVENEIYSIANKSTRGTLFFIHVNM